MLKAKDNRKRLQADGDIAKAARQLDAAATNLQVAGSLLDSTEIGVAQHEALFQLGTLIREISWGCSLHDPYFARKIRGATDRVLVAIEHLNRLNMRPVD